MTAASNQIVYTYVIEALVEAQIPFHVHYVDATPVVNVSETVTNEQLGVLTRLGAHMTPNREFMILTSRTSA